MGLSAGLGGCLGAACLLATLWSVEVPAQGSVQYKPPKRGAPASRVGGATRAAGDQLPQLVVLAPDHTGVTLREQPDLYWHVSRATPARLEITVINEQAEQPVMETAMSEPRGPGLQRIRLAEHGARLKPGVEYRWFISLVVDPKQRSNDVIASGTILYEEPGAALVERIAAAPRGQRHRLLAGEGIWYDAVASLVESIGEQPGNAALRGDLASLLEQVGISDAIRP